MTFELINPQSLGAPSGYSNGLLTEPGGRLLFIAGQIAWNEKHEIVSDDFVEQFDKAVENVMTVVREAGGKPSSIARILIYVTTKTEYLEWMGAVGERYRMHMEKRFPAMVLFQVAGLVHNAAKVEIEGIAAL